MLFRSILNRYIEEYVDCTELDDEDELIAGFGINDTDECPCEEWYEEDYTLYWNDIRHKVLLSTKPLLDIIDVDRWDGLVMDDLDFGNATNVIETEDVDYDDNYDEATEWDYHNIPQANGENESKPIFS